VEINGVHEVKRALQPLNIRHVKKGFEVVGAQTQENKGVQFLCELETKKSYHE
jgi:hypothetical protein